MVAVLVGWALWPQPDPEPRQRAYAAQTACLLTGAGGVADPVAQPVWAGMQEGSLATRVKVQYLEVDGAQTVANAETFLASLVQTRCDLILTVGEAPSGAVRATAARFPSARFVAFGPAEATSNVSVVDSSDPETVRRSARDLVTGLSPAVD
ncbi:hypothetical protein AWW66_22870 [Micromonospora rosaria]|uniref:BMP family ABC transporter substrate-binding protein n=1 Tax=Micromonospora rosaria TaxID=47874 RepID=A0A136PMS6_9ACTN|nr:hypothetical protein AWW66_22870 [Micromonospora rosaria]